MPELPVCKLAIVGTGNMAWHLGLAFMQSGLPVNQILGRKPDAARTLALETGALHWATPDEIDRNTDCCLICVSDDAIETVARSLNLRHCFLLHTAGSIPMNILEKYTDNCGVLYPLQSLTRGYDVDFAEVPFLIEANSLNNLVKLKEIAGLLSGNIMQVDSETRQMVHLAAVFTNNFTNHMFTLAADMVKERGLPFDLLVPLIRETLRKAVELGPGKAQTGPAMRANLEVMEKHLALLSDRPRLKELYALISESIRNQGITKN